MRRSRKSLLLFLFFPCLFFAERFGFSLFYDTNPFLLSDSQINLFLSGKDFGIKTYDDLAIKLKGDLFNWRIKENRFLLTFTGNLFYQNPIKSYGVFSSQWKRFFGQLDRYVIIRYEFCPYYLIRPLKKENLSYASHSWEGSLTFSKTSLLFNFALRNYPTIYNYYDSKLYSLGLKERLSLGKKVGELTLGLKLNLLKALGKDPDISYRGIEGILGYKSPLGFSLSFSLEKRDFTTNFDLRHKGRRDLMGELEFSFFFPFNKKSGLSFSYLYKKRDTTAEIEELSEIKDYERGIFSVGVKYE